MPENNDIRYSMSRATEMSERARDRMLADMERQRQQSFQSQASHQSYVNNLQSSAQSAMAGAYAATSNAGRGVIDNMMVGGRVAQEQLGYAANNISAAFGFGGGPNITGQNPPIDRGYSSNNYFEARQSFGGLLYESGLGDVMSTLTGGYFFQDVNQMIGMPAAQLRARSQAELGLRYNQFFKTIGSSLPLAGRRGVANQGIYSMRARELTQQFSGVRTDGIAGGMVGGRGFASNSRFISQVADAEQRAFADINRSMGYSLTDEDAAGLSRIADTMMTDIDRQRMVDMGGQRAGAKREQILRDTKKMLEDLRMDINEGMQFVSELRGVMDPDQIQEYVRGSMRQYGTSSMQLNRGEYIRFQSQFMMSGIQSGMGVTQAQAYGASMVGLANQYQMMGNAGGISRDVLNYFGGAGGLARFTEATGASTMGASPYLTTLAGADPSALTQALRGGSYMGAMTSAAVAQAGNPFALLEAQFDPSARSRMQRFGMRAAFTQAQSAVSELGVVFGGSVQDRSRNRRAQVINQFMRNAGLNDPAKAMYLYDMYASQSRTFRELGVGDDKMGLAMDLYDRLSASAITPEEVAALTGKLDAGTPLHMLSAGALVDSVREDDVKVPGVRMYRSKDEVIRYSLDGTRQTAYSPAQYAKRFVERDGTVYDLDRAKSMFRSGRGIRGTDLASMLQDLMAAGYSEELINQRLTAGGKNAVRLRNGQMQVWGQGGWSNYSENEGYYGSYFGDDDWEAGTATRLVRTVEDLGTNRDLLRAESGQLNREIGRNFKNLGSVAKALFGVSAGGESGIGYLSKVLGDSNLSADEKRFRKLIETGEGETTLALANRLSMGIGDRDLSGIIASLEIASGSGLSTSAALSRGKELAGDKKELAAYLESVMQNNQKRLSFQSLVMDAFVRREADAVGLRFGEHFSKPLWVKEVKD